MGEFPKSQNFFRKNSSSQNFYLQDFFDKIVAPKIFFEYFSKCFLETISVSKIFVKNISEAKIIAIKIFGGKIFWTQIVEKISQYTIFAENIPKFPPKFPGFYWFFFIRPVPLEKSSFSFKISAKNLCFFFFFFFYFIRPTPQPWAKTYSSQKIGSKIFLQEYFFYQNFYLSIFFRQNFGLQYYFLQKILAPKIFFLEKFSASEFFFL